jgi:hypothetical protein
MRYARIVDGNVVELRDFAIPPDPNPLKCLDWRPCPPSDKPPIDPATHKVLGPNYRVADAMVEETWSVAPLSDDDREMRRAAALASLGDPLLTVLHAMHNRIRATEGKPAEPMPRFHAWLKELL